MINFQIYINVKKIKNWEKQLEWVNVLLKENLHLKVFFILKL